MMEAPGVLAAALVGRYALERELGRGGMATVYLAEDCKHHRRVAVKVLRAELAASLGTERFLREIAIAAQLQHPHILMLIDSGEAAGFLYYVMPYVEGESLRDRLRREGPLPLEDALQVAREVADALSYAHSRGVVHRDIKPENILLTGGHAVVADFGIARAIGAAGAARLTETGIAVGTPAYMSPEQTTGEQQLDGRSDVYSLGCVLYEMLAGEPPFTGPSAQAVLARHSLQPVPSVRVVRPAVPQGVEAAIVKALAKTPADRFPTAQEFTTALRVAEGPSARSLKPDTGPRAARGGSSRRQLVYLAVAAAILVVGYQARTWLRPGVQAAARPRLLVLPLQNLGPGDEEYFADGITEEITGRLASIGRLAVIARTSAMQYKRTTKSVRQIGEELSVAYVIEGSVRRDRSQGRTGKVRVSSRLIKVADGTQVWGDEYDVARAEILSVQSRIAERVAGALNLVLLEPERRRLAARATENAEAYDDYLRGNSYYNRSWERSDVEAALEMYGRAVALDPGFALAFAQIGKMHAWMYRLGYDVTEARLRAAKTAADSALTLNPGLPEAHIALGLYYYWGRFDYDHAIAELLTARTLQPGNALVYQNIGNVRRRQGQWEETIKNYERAAELDPRSHVIWFDLGETHLHLRQYEQAERYFDRVISLAPDFFDGYLLKAALAIHRDGDVESARRVLDRSAERIPPSSWRPLWGFWWMGFSRIIYRDADDALSRMKPGVYGLDSAGYYAAKAEVLVRADRAALTRACFDSARVLLERARARRPDQAWVDGMLGVVYAALSRPSDAVRAAQHAAELVPVSRDGFDGPDWVVNLARVYMMVGQRDAALDNLELALAIPSRVSSNWLRLDPAWAPLRGDARFQRLLERKRVPPLSSAMLP